MRNRPFTFSLVTAAILFCGTQAVGQSQGGETVRDRIWIWGHPAGVYNESFLAMMPKTSTIEPVAAADFMGVRNMIFVRYDGKPAPPFDIYYVPFQKLDRVYWSLVGASGATSADEREQVFRLAETHHNVAGFILDDFFHLDLQDLEGNLTRLEKLVRDKPVFLGCYMYDFADHRPLPVDLMQRQTELGYKWLKEGRLEGLIFLATPNVDVDLEAVAWTRQWIARMGDEPSDRR